MKNSDQINAIIFIAITTKVASLSAATKYSSDGFSYKQVSLCTVDPSMGTDAFTKAVCLHAATALSNQIKPKDSTG